MFVVFIKKEDTFVVTSRILSLVKYMHIDITLNLFLLTF